MGFSNHNFKFSEAIIHLYVFLRWKLLNAMKSGKDKKKKKQQTSVYLNGIAIPYFSIGHMLLKS